MSPLRQQLPVSRLHEKLRAIAIFSLAVLLAASSGCSRISIAYHSADFLVERYARDYLAVDDPQIASWHPNIEAALARHRREDLPYLARFFDYAHEGALKGFDSGRMRCLFEQFEGLYHRHMQLAVDLAAPLLAGLTPAQIRALDNKFRDEKAEDEADLDPASTARRERKRAERYQETIAWWTGPLTGKQAAIVREQTAAMPDTAVDWIRYRSAKREALIGLLQRSAGEPEIHGFLLAWLVEHRALPVPLQKARDQIFDRIAGLFIRMDDSFSSEQRAHFAGRLADLRDDFMSLQQRPRMASLSCTGTG